MQDTFSREIQIGDIVVRIMDWGASYLSIVQSTTPGGYLRVISYHEQKEEFVKGGILKNTSNVFILNEPFLRAHVGGMYRGEVELSNEELVQIYLDQQQVFQQ